ncbi:[protein-PII] uridylyltransferase [Thermodesulfobacteriota bacterium]
MKPAGSLVQAFLTSRESLFQTALDQHSGLATALKYSDLMDRFIRSIFLLSGFDANQEEIKEKRLVLLALGGYGRRELCLGSDVDLLLVHQGSLSSGMKTTIQRALHTLWDAKLEVGHSVLTIQECRRLAFNDFRFFTAMIDARFLMGPRAFYHLFDSSFWSRIERDKNDLLKHFLISRQKRSERYNSEEYFVEPDIKEGLGGLRDFHMMAWIARVYFYCKRLSQIKRFSVFSHFALNKLTRSKGFLYRVRNHLHLLTGGRREDRLLLDFQQGLAQNLGYNEGLHDSAPERFMRDLYLHLNRIRYGLEEFLDKILDMLDSPTSDLHPLRISSEFSTLKDNVILGSGSLTSKSPLLVLRAFDEARRHEFFLGSGLIWEAAKKISSEGKELLESPEARRLFLNLILKPSQARLVRLALEIGLISLFIPEFKKIRNRVQFGHYHVLTVDLHSLKTLEVLHDISKGVYDERWPLLSEIFHELQHPERLLLAGLLHDLGKGYHEDHPARGALLIPRILKRLGFKNDAQADVAFLVKNHLLLAIISQRRDLNDEKTAVQVAQKIQETELLKLLFILTMADSIATGPLASSDWKVMLLIELFFKVRHILEKGTLASPDVTNKVKALQLRIHKTLKDPFPREAVTELMDQVSIRYFMNTPYEDMVRHFQLALNLGEEKLAWKLEKLKDAQVTRIILCTYDKPGLFSKMAGILTLNNIEVLSANVFTLKNGLAFDTYEVTNPLDPYREEERWNKIREEVILALEERFPLDNLISRKRKKSLAKMKRVDYGRKKVNVNNEISDFFTAIEINSGARLGLLYDAAKKISYLDLDIRFAKVNSDKERMEGVFYIRDSGGQKIFEEDRIENIRHEIMSVLS